jgi:hypothetical protein
MTKVSDVENVREAWTRTVSCPVCDRGPGELCVYPSTWTGHFGVTHRAHTGRYLLAASKGLVPLLPGGEL